MQRGESPTKAPQQIGGQEEESLQKMRAALANPNGTSSEKRERVISAWTSLRSVTTSTENKTKLQKHREKGSRHEDGSKRSAKKKNRVQDGQGGSTVLMAEEKRNLLHDAARMGHADRVRELVADGVKITSKNNSGYTALHWASLYGHTEVVRTLLGLGAGDGKRINCQNDSGNTALHLACSGRHAQVAAMLQVYKADEYRANSYGQTPVSLGLRDLVESVRRIERLDAIQSQKDDSRRHQVMEISDWHIGKECESLAIPNQDISNIYKKRLRGYWSSWDAYEAAWRTFSTKFADFSGSKKAGTSSSSDLSSISASDGDSIQLKDVPWPVTELQLIARETNQGDEGLLLAELGASGATLRSLIQQERLRWHPDKFLQVFGRHLSPEDRTGVLAGVQKVIRLLNSLADETDHATKSG